MNYQLLIFGAISLTLLFVGCKNEKIQPESPLAYYKMVVPPADSIVSYYDANLLNSISTFKARQMSTDLEAMKDHIARTELSINRISPLGGGEDLLSSTKQLIYSYKKALPIFEEMVSIESQSDADYDESDARKYDQLVQKLVDTIQEPIEEFGEVVAHYADKNHLLL